MEYRIRGEIRATGNGQFVAIAVAIPFDGPAAARSLQDTCATRAQAAERLRAMLVQLGAAIRSEGGEVLDVRSDD